jgi:hypothetical protein
MSRIYVFMRHSMNNSALHPQPPAGMRVPRASDVTLELILVDLGDDKSPIDLDGRDITFTVKREKYSDNTEVIEKTLGNGITADPLNLGHVDIALTAGDLTLLPTEYWYDISISTPTGGVIRHSLGKFVLMP